MTDINSEIVKDKQIQSLKEEYTYIISKRFKVNHIIIEDEEKFLMQVEISKTPYFEENIIRKLLLLENSKHYVKDRNRYCTILFKFENSKEARKYINDLRENIIKGDVKDNKTNS